jgi:hypothetical protein
MVDGRKVQEIDTEFELSWREELVRWGGSGSSSRGNRIESWLLLVGVLRLRTKKDLP